MKPKKITLDPPTEALFTAVSSPINTIVTTDGIIVKTAAFIINLRITNTARVTTKSIIETGTALHITVNDTMLNRMCAQKAGAIITDIDPGLTGTGLAADFVRNGFKTVSRLYLPVRYNTVRDS